MSDEQVEPLAARGPARGGQAPSPRLRVRTPPPLRVSDSATRSRQLNDALPSWEAALPRRPSVEVLPGLVAQAPEMQHLARLVRRAASLDLPVLVRGESGTGKELIARAVHTLGPRARRPFVAINGATLGEALAESALFGHTRGAYTGASEPRAGAFRRADGGTLFIDEVASLPQRVQSLLLRVLEEGTIVALGDDRATPVDVRVVTATCEPLEQLVDEGRFRADLYQRLAVCVAMVPPLRERLDDLPALVDNLVEQIPAPCRVEPCALRELEGHHYPGNVRELRNVLTQALLASEDGIISAHEVAAALKSRRGHAPRSAGPRSPRALVAECRGNISSAARRAGIPRSTFRDRLRREGARGPLKSSPPKPRTSR